MLSVLHTSLLLVSGALRQQGLPLLGLLVFLDKCAALAAVMSHAIATTRPLDAKLVPDLASLRHAQDPLESAARSQRAETPAGAVTRRVAGHVVVTEAVLDLSVCDAGTPACQTTSAKVTEAIAKPVFPFLPICMSTSLLCVSFVHGHLLLLRLLGV